MTRIEHIREEIVACNRCPRLRHYCERIGREKRAAFREDTYWARPVPGFGDPSARVLVLGLAPAAHGANRTGRNFTGDGAGGSGDFLMAAMHANGLANQPTSRSADDGLHLRDAWIAATVRCAPPDNKPTPAEIAACHRHLRAEVDALPHVRVIVALGRIAFDACWRLFAERGIRPRRRPLFRHGEVYREPGAPVVIASYHPSRQNTHTGRLTAAMLERVFAMGSEVMGSEVACVSTSDPITSDLGARGSEVLTQATSDPLRPPASSRAARRPRRASLRQR